MTRRSPSGGVATVAAFGGLAFTLLGACGPAGGGDADHAPGTVRMAERLALLADSADPLEDEQLNLERLRHYTELPPVEDPARMILRQGIIAREMLHAGLTAPAVDQLLLLRDLLAGANAEPVPGFRESIDELAGVALLRRGMELACPEPRSRAGGPGGAELVFPCWPSVPRDEDGPALSDSARLALDRALNWQRGRLQVRSDDLRARWLLNLGAMSAGWWPDSVPPELRLPLESLSGSGSFPRFPDVARGVGLDAVSVSGGGVVEDFDGDGLPDVLVSSRGLRDPLRYFRSDGRGGFVERTAETGLTGLWGGLNLLQADYDDDGDADVLVLRGGWLARGLPNSLLRNDGGHFVDVTEEMGLYSEHPTQTAGWADFDGDGGLDLFIGNESRDGETHVSELYRSGGEEGFERVRPEGLDVAAFVKGVAWGDYDDDGRPDLYLSILHAPNRLYRNAGPTPDGGWRFEDVTEAAGVGEPLASFPAWFWDFDNDGRLDLFVAGYRAQTADLALEALGRPHGAELPRLYRNRGDGTFADVTRERGLDRILYAMGSNFGDIDGDGWLDVLVGTGDPDYRQLMPNRAFRNEEGRFVEITGAGGFGDLDKGHGVSFVDIDHDGDLDVHMVLGGANEGDLSPNALYENPGFGHRWISLELVGDRANRAGVGARIAVFVETAGGARAIHRVAGTGGSFGANPLRQHIGLGDAMGDVNVEIRWPGSGTVDRIEGLALDRAYAIREGSGAAEPLERPRITLGG